MHADTEKWFLKCGKKGHFRIKTSNECSFPASWYPENCLKRKVAPKTMFTDGKNAVFKTARSIFSAAEVTSQSTTPMCYCSYQKTLLKWKTYEAVHEIQWYDWLQCCIGQSDRDSKPSRLTFFCLWSYCDIFCFRIPTVWPLFHNQFKKE